MPLRYLFSIKKLVLALLVALLDLLCSFCGALGPSWVVLGVSRGVLGSSWGALGSSWGALGRSQIELKIDPKIDPNIDSKSSRFRGQLFRSGATPVVVSEVSAPHRKLDPVTPENYQSRY